MEVRPCASAAEELASLEVYNTVCPLEAISMLEVESFKASSTDYVDLLAIEGGTIVGSAAVAIRPTHPHAGLAFVTVLPEHRRRGAGTALYCQLSDWLAERGQEAVDAVAEEDDPASIDFATRRGFVEVERNGRMILELADVEIPPIAPPEGIEIVTWAERPELAAGIYEVDCEATPDVPGERAYAMEPFEDWLAHEMQGPGDLPEATFVAVARDEVVGYAKFSLTRARPDVASHDMTGVKRAWRRRGIAGALKRAQIAWAKENGYRILATTNEMRNEPIRRLNARLGYRTAPGRVFFRGPLATKL